MDLMEAVKTRRSVRSYQARPVNDDDLAEILEAARLAPSASNRQDWKFIIARDKALISELAVVAGQPFIGVAPLVVAGVSLNPQRVMQCDVPAYAVDLAIAMTHIALAAAARGLGTCWIGAFDQERAKKALGVPAGCKVVGLMPLGHPADGPRPKNRKPIVEVVSYDRFQ